MYYNNTPTLLDQLKHLRSVTKLKLEVEEKKLTAEQIELFIEKRIKHFTTDKKRMLNSILDRDIRKITIDRLLVYR